MSAIVIDGKEIAKQIRIATKKRALKLIERGIQPTLAVILVGEDPASEIYVRNKENACGRCEIRFQMIKMPEDTTQDQLHAEIERLNTDPAVHGILIQSPLPKQLDERAALRLVDVKKDVDGFHVLNAGALMLGEPGLVAGTPEGCIELLKVSGVPLDGANAVVIGRSNIVGKPMAMLLLRENCTVTICHSHTKDIADFIRRADIVIAAMRQPNFVKARMIKPGAAVIDVGTHRLSDGTVCGDVDFDEVSQVAGWITPSPGGVGPMTVAVLMRHTVDAAEAYAG